MIFLPLRCATGVWSKGCIQWGHWAAASTHRWAKDCVCRAQLHSDGCSACTLPFLNLYIDWADHAMNEYCQVPHWRVDGARQKFVSQTTAASNQMKPLFRYSDNYRCHLSECNNWHCRFIHPGSEEWTGQKKIYQCMTSLMKTNARLSFLGKHRTKHTK